MMQGNINLTVSGTPEEIAALALELQERLHKKTIEIPLGINGKQLASAVIADYLTVKSRDVNASVTFLVNCKEHDRAVYSIRPADLARICSLLPAFSEKPFGQQPVQLTVDIKSSVLTETQTFEVDPVLVPQIIGLFDALGLRQK